MERNDIILLLWRVLKGIVLIELEEEEVGTRYFGDFLEVIQWPWHCTSINMWRNCSKTWIWAEFILLVYLFCRGNAVRFCMAESIPYDDEY